MKSPYWFTLTEAATAVGVSKDTMKRALRAGKLPNARHRDDDSRTWEVPLGDLTNAGYRVQRPEAAVTAVPAPRTPYDKASDPELRELRERVEHLQLELVAARTLAEERVGRIADLQLALSVISQRPATSERSAS